MIAAYKRLNQYKSPGKKYSYICPWLTLLLLSFLFIVGESGDIVLLVLFYLG
jgi:hypothetical protein